MKVLIKKGLVAATACAAAILGCAFLADRPTAQEDFLAENEKIVTWADETDDGEELVYHIDGTTAAECKSQWDIAVAASTNEKVVTIILDVNWTPNASYPVYVKGISNNNRKNIILDLNSHSISRTETTKQTQGVIKAEYTNLTVLDSVGGGSISGGYAEVFGGGIYVYYGDLTVSGVSFTGNSVTRNPDYNNGAYSIRGCGGAICVSCGNLTVTNCSFTQNIGKRYSSSVDVLFEGGAIWVERGTVDISESQFIGNTTEGCLSSMSSDGSLGNCIYLASCTTTISSCTIQSSTIATWQNTHVSGGGIYAKNGSLTIKDNSTITDNYATNGGAIYAAGCAVTIQDSTITGNTAGNYNKSDTATTNGGGIYVTGGSFEITNSTISGNKALNGRGGGSYLNSANSSLNGCTFNKNTASGDGGGIYTGQDISLTNCSITESESGGNGGGVYLNKANSSLNGCTITGNTAATNGGGVYTNGSAHNFSGKVTITGNKANNKDSDYYKISASGSIHDEGLDNESRIGIDYTGQTTASPTVTTGFGAHHDADVSPSSIFFVNEGSSSGGHIVSDNDETGDAREVKLLKPSTIAKPTAISTKFTYNGSEQTYIPNKFNTSKMKIENNVQTDAGTYTVTVTPIGAAVWEGDLNNDPIPFEFVIGKATPTIAPKQASYNVKEGNEYTVSATASNDETVTIEYYSSEGKLDEAPTAVGSYTVKFSVAETDNYFGATKTVQLTISAHDHVWGDFTYNEDATCEKDGTETATCTFGGCDVTTNRDKSDTKLNHTFTVYVSNNDATCTKNGSETAVCDNGCGKEDKRTVENSKTEHDYESVVTDATCTKKGYSVNTCSVCGDKKTVSIDAKGHDHSQLRAENPWVWAEDYSTAKVYISCSRCDDVVEVEAEVTDNGSQEATCSSSGYIDVSASATYEDNTFDDAQYKVLPVAAHKFEITDFVWEEDYSKATLTYLCSECEIVGDSVEGTVEIKESSDADCENDGFITYTVTIEYGNEQSETKEETVTIEALQHEYEEEVTDPTCTEEGYTTYTCTREGCGYSYVGDNKVEATGHTYEEGKYSYDDKEHWQVCTVCEKDGEKTAHTYEQKEVTKEATDTENGEAVWACACGSEITKSIPMLAHTTHTKGEELKSDGTYHWYECTFEGCEEQLDKEEHDFGDWESGEENHWKTCSVCDQKNTAEAHDFSEWEETTAATCEEEGEEKHACSICGYEETRTIEALGHLIEDDPTWEWSDNYHAATATFVCKNGGSHDVTVAATVTENKENATCTKEGLLSFKATVTLNDEEYIDEKKDVITTLPHTYALTGWDWAEDHSSASVTVECSVCEHSETAEAKIKKNGEYTFVATATVEGVKFTDTVTIDPPAPSDKTVIDGTWNVNGEVPKFESDDSNRVYVTYYDQDGNAVTEFIKGATYSAVITLKDSSNYKFANNLQTVKTFTAKFTTAIEPDPDNPNYKPLTKDGTGDEPADSSVMAYVPMGLSGVSIVLIITFAVMTYNSAAAAKSAQKKAKRMVSNSYSFAPIGLLALVLGVSQSGWWVIAGILMACALIMGIVALLFNGKKKRALEMLEEEQENVRANEKVRREDEMRMMFAAMQQNAQQPQMNYGDMRSLIQETVAALLPGIQQLQALPPASQDNADGAQGNIDDLQAKMEEQQELLTQILENQQNYVMPLYEDDLEDDLAWLGESEETVSLEESYGALSDEGKQAYYDIGSYIINKPRVSQNDGMYAVLFKYRGKTVFKLVIKEDAPVLYYPSNDGGVKSEVRVADASSVEFAKGIVDGVIASVEK